MKKRFIFLALVTLVVFSVQSIAVSTAMAAVSERTKSLETAVQELVAQQSGSWQVFIKDLKTKEEIQLNSRSGESAGLMKIWIAAETYRQAKSGMISLQDKIAIDVSNKSGGVGHLKQLPDGTQVAYSEILDAMLTAGDNTATNVLIEKLGWANLNNTIANLGCDDTAIGKLLFPPKSKRNPRDGHPPGYENRTSVKDVGLILEKLYFGQVVGNEADAELLNQMRRTSRNRIARLLPGDIPVARQTGSLIKPRVLHDAGIIYGKNTDIIVAVMTHNVKGSAKVISQIGKLAYDHLDHPQGR